MGIQEAVGIRTQTTNTCSHALERVILSRRKRQKKPRAAFAGGAEQREKHGVKRALTPQTKSCGGGFPRFGANSLISPWASWPWNAWPAWRASSNASSAWRDGDDGEPWAPLPSWPEL